jgi:pilus assembly protein CpaC
MLSCTPSVCAIKALRSIPGLLAGLLAIALFSSAIFAQEAVIRSSFKSASKAPVTVGILTGQSSLLVFDQPIGRVAISNQDAAEAVPVAPNQLVINGKSPGRARLTTWSNQDDQFIFFDIDVRANLEQIDAQVRALFPKEDIRLSQNNGSVVISGKADPKIAQQIESVVQAAGFKTVNLLAVPILNIAQVQLQVRVAEVSRNKLTELAAAPVVLTQPGEGGYTNTGLGPYTVNGVDQGNILGTVSNALNVFVMSNNAGMFIRALQTQGALRGLAEPNLIAMNGQQASFLAGGEVPIPVVQGGNQNGTVSITYKEYGVRVNFKPTILDEQHIRLEVEPEVSTLDYNNAVRLNGFLIPALRVRRAKTGIELQDGQSFGIAGLMDNNELKSLSKIPVLGDVPILGNLFKSKSFQKSESELVFIVTTKITRPVNPDSMPQYRGVDGLKNGSPLGVEPPGAASGGSTGGSTGALKSGDAPGASKSAGMTGGSKAIGAGVTGESGHATSGNVTGDKGSTSGGAVIDVPVNANTPASDKKAGDSKEPAGKGMENNSQAKQEPATAPARRLTALRMDSLGWPLMLPRSQSQTAERAP